MYPMGMYVSNSGQITMMASGSTTPIVTDVDHYWDDSTYPHSQVLGHAASTARVAWAYMGADPASFMGMRDLLQKGLHLTRYVPPTWAGILHLVGGWSPDDESLALAIHLDGALVEMSLADCTDGVVEVLECQRFLAAADERALVRDLGQRIGEMLVLQAPNKRVDLLFANRRLDLVVSTPNGPSDHFVDTLRSFFPTKGIALYVHRLDHDDLADGALVQAGCLTGHVRDILVLGCTWFSVNALCGTERIPLLAPGTTLPTMSVRLIEEPGKAPMAIELVGADERAITVQLPSLPAASMELEIDVDANMVMTLFARDKDSHEYLWADGVTVGTLVESSTQPIVPHVSDVRQVMEESREHAVPKTTSGTGRVPEGDVAPKTSQQPGPQAIDLRNAIVKALVSSGHSVLRDSKRLIATVNDFATDESPELRVLLYHADRELLDPFADALCAQSVAAVSDARQKAMALLCEERVVQGAYARSVTWALASAVAQVMGA